MMLNEFTKAHHFGCRWKLFLKYDDELDIFIMSLEAKKQTEPTSDWSIDSTIDVKTFKTQSTTHEFSATTSCVEVQRISRNEYAKLPAINWKTDLAVECHVTINNMTGIKKLRNFDKESAEKFSDVVLIVVGEKFYVLKKFLACHSTYFESLLLGNFSESQKSEIELKDIDPWDFQKFLEVLYGESAIKEDTVDGILKLADMYDAPTATSRCAEFLEEKSKKSLKQKFELAVKYHLAPLVKKCISEMKTPADIRSIKPKEPTEIDAWILNELLELALTFHST